MYKKRKMLLKYFICLFAIIILITNCAGKNRAHRAKVKIVAVAETFMFDDFNYTSVPMLESNGWTVRTKEGWPGIPGAQWKKENVSFHEDPANEDNRFLRMTSTIGKLVTQTQVCHQRKYLEGTYAARVRFTNESTGTLDPGKDEVIQSFYAITPYEKPLDPAFSELDFEYLPNGGWGMQAGTLMTTTWDTVQIEPWIARNGSYRVAGNYEGWHILMIQVGVGIVHYLIDGKLIAETRDPNYPDAPMSINFNLWFINNEKPLPENDHTYIEEIDWVFHARNVIMYPKDILQQVDNLRTRQVGFYDNVPTGDPPLDCPCDL